MSAVNDLIQKWEKQAKNANELARDNESDFVIRNRLKTKEGVIKAMLAELKRAIREDGE